MTTPTLALIHSPLTSAAAWGDVPNLLRDHGHSVVVPEVFDDLEPPYATRFVARVALQLAAESPNDQVVLVGHGDAGPLLPSIGFARHSAGVTPRGYVFVDATLPRTTRGSNRIDLIRLEDATVAATLEDRLHAGGRWPDWAESELAKTLPDMSQRALLLAGLRPRALDYYTETLPLTDDWPDARCGYLRLSGEHLTAASTARHRGWAVAEEDLHPFAALSHPDAVSDSLLTLTANGL